MTTTTPLEDLACYVPALILRRMHADLGATLAPASERFPAAVLYADLSGFTALTEHLTQNSPAGAEELTSILDLYFGHLVGVVMSHGGDVVKFAGDGLLALWYGEESLQHLAQRAVQCALAVQMMMAPEAWGSVDGVAPPPALKVRVGVGAGDVTTMHVGGIFGRWELLVTGEALLGASRAESEANPGEVVIAAAAWPLVAHACAGQPLPSGAVRLVGLTDYLPMRRLDPPPLVPAMADALRSYIPKAILARIDAGQTAWLAEQRRVTVLFINLPDLRDGTPLRQAQALMHALQTALYRYQGSVARLGTDAKGPTLVAALGLPPFAHEDDPERGVRAALAIHDALAGLGFGCAIGVTTGRALCGAVGAETRREYTMMGAIVNRSARLMQVAAAGALPGAPPVLCDAATYRGARARLAFEALPPMVLKGVAEPVPIYRPLAARQPQATGSSSATILGRERDQQIIGARLELFAREARSGAIIIEGEAGIGKSALLAAVRERARATGLRVLAGGGSPVEIAPYHAWRPIFAELLGDLAARGPEPVGTALGLHAALAELGAAELAPLLAAVLPLDLPDTPLTGQMVGQVRADNTRGLLVRLLRWAGAPLVLMFDDAQWLDASSWALIQAVSEQVPGLLLIMATRPMDPPPAIYQRLAYQLDTMRLPLRGMDAAELLALLTRRLGVASLPPQVWELIAPRARGNPFVAEELLLTLRDAGVIHVSDGVCRLADGAGNLEQLLAGVHLPETVQGLITSRIDQLSAAQQLTLKVASVIGPLFSLSALAAIHPVERDRERLVEQLFALQQAGLVLIEAFEPDLVYAFKHGLGAEVAYNLMSYAQRRRLHRALAERYEALGVAAGVSAAQLAHHWRQADEPLRAARYLARAGEQALRGGAYRDAAVFFGDALATAAERPAGVGDGEQASWERQLGEAYHGMGRLIESREQLERAVARMGYQVPRHPVKALLVIAGGLVREGSHLLLPRRRPGVVRGSADAARAYALLAQLAYYDGQLLSSIAAAFQALGLAEQSGPSPELAGAYAVVHVATGAIPPLAQLYRLRAQRAAQRLGHLPTLGWVAEAQGLHDIGRGGWRRATAALGVAVAIAERLGDRRRRSEALAARCLAYCCQGAYAIALAGCEELQADGLRAGDVQVRTWGLVGAAENLLCLGEDGRAELLLAEAEALLAENLGGARAEEVWAYALMGRAALRRGAYDLAWMLAHAAAGLVGAVPPATIYALGGYSAIAEVFLGLLEAGYAHNEVDRRALDVAVRRSCAGLKRLALIFPVAAPAALLWDGLRHQCAGRHKAARRCWQRAADRARRLGMPYDEARARFQMGRHATGQERVEQLQLAEALFRRLGCTYELAAVQALLAHGSNG